MEPTEKSLNVFFLTTQYEYLTGEVDNACQLYLDLKPSLQKRKFHLLFIFNTGAETEYRSLLAYERHPSVRKVTIKSMNISQADDVYTKEVTLFKFEELGAPWLGLSMGPNLLFFQAMDYLRTQPESHSLLLETDSYPVREGWYDRLLQYTVNNDFLIAGSHYKGNTHIPDSAEWKWHLNGVAIYRNCWDLKRLLTDAKADIVKRVSSGQFYQWNFDVAIHMALQLPKYKNVKCKLQRCINIDLIANMTLPDDAKITDKEVMFKYPKVYILHKKK